MRRFELLLLLELADDDTIGELKKLSDKMARAYCIYVLIQNDGYEKMEKLIVLTDEFITYWYMAAFEYGPIFHIDKGTKTDILSKELYKLGVPNTTTQRLMPFVVQAEVIAHVYNAK